MASLDSVAADTSETTSDSISSAKNTPNPFPTALPTAGISVLHCKYIYLDLLGSIGCTAKIVYSIQKLVELTGQRCQTEGCTAVLSFKYHVTGCVISIVGTCSNHHCFSWNSSDKLIRQAQGQIYVDNIHFVSALILSGNHYKKLRLRSVGDCIYLCWRPIDICQKCGGLLIHRFPSKGYLVHL